MSKIILFGNEAVAREVFYCLKHFSDQTVVGFTVDEEYIENGTLFSLPVVPFGAVESVFPPDEHEMMIAVGYVQNNRIRADRYRQARDLGYTLPSFVSPRAVTYPDTAIGENCFIGHYSSVSPNARIGNNVFMGNGCTIGHDTVISDHCFLSNDVAISGSVTIGSHCYFGTNCTVRNRVTIGSACVVGAGATVLENVDDRSVLLGEPATLLPISSDKLHLG